MVRVLVLWADQHSANLGLQALARGAESLASRLFSVPVEVSNLNFGTSPIRFGPSGIARDLLLPNGPIREVLGHHELVLDTGAGDSFTDLYGLRRLLVLVYLRWAASKRSERVLVSLPQTVGPFHTRIGRHVAARGARLGEIWYARDSVSLTEASRLLGLSGILSTDLVFAIRDDPRPAAARDLLFNVSGLVWNGLTSIDPVRYRQFAHSMISRLQARGRDVSLFAHVLDNPSLDNDVPAATQLAKDHGCELVIPSDLDDGRAAIANANLVVGSRMHACLNALSLGTPSVALSYSRKFSPLLSDLHWWPALELPSVLDDPRPVLEMIDHVEATAAERVCATLRHAHSLIDTTVLDLAARLRMTGLQPVVREADAP